MPASLPSTYFVSSYEEKLLETRYKDPRSTERTWEDIFIRVSDVVGGHDAYKMMEEAIALPSSPQLWNYGAGNRRFSRNGSSCFTGRMGDSLADFRQADADAESIYVASGGFGLLCDTVRPRGCMIKHCAEGSMGSMCAGGPAARIEGTTGYITGSGRSRGALMLQLSAWHPDAVEFILVKRPTSLGFLDDWPANARAQIATELQDVGCEAIIDMYASKYVFRKEWPSLQELRVDALRRGGGASSAVDHLLSKEVLKDINGRAVPQVMDWGTGAFREANRDWDLPLQNCNMSIRIPDALFEAADRDKPWTFCWFSPNGLKEGQVPWTKTDAFSLDGELEQIEDGTAVAVSCDYTKVERVSYRECKPYRYGVVITTWEGLRQNLSPNENQWRDTDYARFYRKIALPALSGLRGRIMAKQVEQLIAENAWNHADPGVVFSDTYERFQPVDSTVYGPRLSNPCMPNFATMLTPEGIKPFEAIKVGSLVWSGKSWTKVTRKWATGTKPVYAFRTTAGVFIGTEDHRVVSEGVKVAVSETESIDLCLGGAEGLPLAGHEQDVLDGLVLGDGSPYSRGLRIILQVEANDQSYFSSEVASLLATEPSAPPYRYLVQTTIESGELPVPPERQVPDRFFYGSELTVRAFLRGLYSANGSVVADRVTLKASSFSVIDRVQQMLSSLGIRSYYTMNKSKEVEFSNGVYRCKQSYDLNITSDRQRFCDLIGFIQPYKMEKLAAVCTAKRRRKTPKETYEIVEREYLGEFEVFDFTVEAEEHTVWSGGLLVSNCCVSGTTFIDTSEGRIQIKDLAQRALTGKQQPPDGKELPHAFCWNRERGIPSVQPILDAWKSGEDQEVYEVLISNGVVIKATAHHPFMLRNEEYARVDELKPGDLLHGALACENPHVVSVSLAPAREDVYNITVDVHHNFGASDSAYGPSVIVKNSEYVASAGGSCNLISPNLRWAVEQVDESQRVAAIAAVTSTLDTRALTSEADWLQLRDSSAFKSYLTSVSASALLAYNYISEALDYNQVPVEYIQRLTSEDYRTVGVGMMGLAEALMYFHVRYGSECAQCFSAATMSEIALTCWENSFLKAVQGVKKPKGWSKHRMEGIFGRRLAHGGSYLIIENQMKRWQHLIDRVQKGEYATNTAVTSVAPTGTISQIAGWQMSRAASNGHRVVKVVTGSIEPPMGWVVGRHDNNGKTIIEHDLWATREHRGKPWMVTATSLPAEGHIRMQAAVCAFCCMSASKTINLPTSATVDEVKQGYRLAWELGIPGTALYRDGSKPMQVLTALECPSGECSIEGKMEVKVGVEEEKKVFAAEARWKA